MKIHFIIVNKDVKEDYFADATFENNVIKFTKNGVANEFTIINNNSISLKRIGEMKYTQVFELNKKTKGNYEIMGLKINISVLTTKISINEKGFFIEYDHYIDDLYEGKIKVYLKY